MAHWTCEQCGEDFERNRAGSRIPRFCSQDCYRLWRKENGITGGQFEKGSAPWNKNLKGIHLSPATEFKEGQKSISKLPLGSIRIRVRRRNGKVRKRAWIKIADEGKVSDWKPRALIVWEEHYGFLPEDLLIHHVDRNPLNDTITNLAALSRGTHLMEHRPEFEEKRARRASVATKARHEENRTRKYDAFYWEDVDEWDDEPGPVARSQSD